MLNIVSFILMLSFAACKKEPPKPTIPIAEKTPIVWIYDTKTNAGLATQNFIYKNMIIQGSQPSSGSQTAIIRALTIDSGKVVWNTDVLPVNTTVSNTHAIKDNYLAVTGDKDLIVIDMDNGNILWNYTDPIAQSSVGISIIDNYIYFSISKGRILQFDIQTGNHKTILTLRSEDLDGYRPVLTAPALWRHPSGDEILIMGNRSYNGQVANYDRYDMLAYNLTADTMLWYKKGVAGIRGSISTPLVQNNKVVFYVERNVECVNPLNGEPVWTHIRHLADNYSAYKSGNITSLGNIVIAKPDSDYMYGIDINTGNELWSNPNTASMPYTIRIAMDKVWYGSGGVNCIDAKTGKTLIDGWRYQNRGSWINPIAVDEKTGYIYTFADGMIYCLDANMLMGK